MDVSEASAQVYCQHQELLALSTYSRWVDINGSAAAKALLSGANPSRIRGAGLDFSELKNYQAGDDVRHMDWKKTHSSGRPHVRMFEEDKEKKVSLLVDQGASLFFASQGQMKSVLAAKLASLLAWSVLDRSDQLSFNVASAVCPQVGEFSRSKASLARALSGLAEANQALDRHQKSQANNLLQSLQQLQKIVGVGQLVYIVSDFESLNEELTELLKQLASRSEIRLFFVYDPMERELPESDQLIVSDGQWQLAINADDGPIRQRYTEVFEQKCEALQCLQADLGVTQLGLSALSTDQEIMSQMCRSPGRVA